MDQFLTSVTPLVWPLATLVIAALFRQDVSKALGRVGQFKYRDLELTFRDDLRQAEQLARSVAPPPTPTPTPTKGGSVVLEVAAEPAKELSGRLIVAPASSHEVEDDAESPLNLVDRSPREAVEAAWTILQTALARATSSLGDRRATGPTNPDIAARFLVSRGHLAGPEALLVGLLRTLRDRARRLDQPAPSAEDARRFVNLALPFASKIGQLG